MATASQVISPQAMEQLWREAAGKGTKQRRIESMKQGRYFTRWRRFTQDERPTCRAVWNLRRFSAERLGCLHSSLAMKFYFQPHSRVVISAQREPERQGWTETPHFDPNLHLAVLPRSRWEVCAALLSILAR